MTTLPGPGPGPGLPPLPSLNKSPSWVNRAGRIDRSACIELRASDLWPSVPPSLWISSSSPSPFPRERVGVRVHNRKNPSPTASSHCFASASIEIDAPWLDALTRARSPRRLLGDLRTTKSNALKSPLTDSRQPIADSLLSPNSGPNRTKKFALPEFWSQSITLQRWVFLKHSSSLAPRRLLQQLLSSSQISNRNSEISSRSPLAERRKPTVDSPFSPSDFRRLTRTQHFLLCPRCNRKVLLLYLPLCTQQESDEADLAQGWITLLDSHFTPSVSGATTATTVNPTSPKRERGNPDVGVLACRRFGVLSKPLPPSILSLRARIIDRYGILFLPRQLLCRSCLQLRYGEIKHK